MVCGIQTISLVIYAQYNLNTNTVQVFKRHHVLLSEYGTDLKDYMESSYGFREGGTNSTCLLVKNLIVQMATTSTSNKVSAYFTHSVTLFLFLTSLGTFKDRVPLQSDNYEQHRRRAFRGSKMCPFAGSFAAVRYKCSRPSEDENNVKIVFLLNQKPMLMPWCKNGSAICTLSELRRWYNNALSDSCRSSGTADNSVGYVQVSIIVLLVIFFVVKNFVITSYLL